MSQRARVIPVLTIDGNRLVKTVKFKNPNYLGDPINAIKIFNDKMVDEIVVLDITASKNNREPNYDLIYEMAGECFSPLGYGGGVSTYDQAARIFSLGVEKIIFNSVVNANPQVITETAKAFGSQSVVVSIDVKKKLLGALAPSFKSASDTGKLGLEEFASYVEGLGAGEIVINDVERDGTFKGMNYDLIKRIAGSVGVPVVACGGANSIDNLLASISHGASAVAAGSIFAYKGNNTKSILISYPTPEDLLTTS